VQREVIIGAKMVSMSALLAVFISQLSKQGVDASSYRSSKLKQRLRRYRQIEELETAIAEKQIERQKEGILLPSVCIPDVPAIFCWDNNDLQEETLSGIVQLISIYLSLMEIENKFLYK